MKRQSNPALACCLACAAGSFWFAVTGMFSQEQPAPRRVVRVFVWLASCAVWTANLAAELWARKKENAGETDGIEQIEEDIFYE